MAWKASLLLFFASVLLHTSALKKNMVMVNYEAMEATYDRFPRNVERKSMIPSPFKNDEKRLISTPAKFLNLSALQTFMFDLEEEYKQIVKLWSIGQSVANRTFYAVQISRNVTEKRKLLKPSFKFVANIQGDDVIAYDMMVSLIKYLAYNDKSDDRITAMLDTIDIWIVPTMNPDALEKSIITDSPTSKNNNGIDLDEDFPNKFRQGWSGRPGQPETARMMKFIRRKFVLSGNIQCGDNVVTYPWDYVPDGRSSLTDDNDVFVDLAKKYALYNPNLRLGQCMNTFHQNGIANGNYYRRKPGSMQDANYMFSNCFEITIHLLFLRNPTEYYMLLNWHQNLESMLSFIESTRQGAYGFVKDKEGEPIKNAVVKVRGRSKEVKVTIYGEYWRLLVWGAYEIVASAPGYKEEASEVVLFIDDPYVRRDFTLTQQGIHGRVVDEAGDILTRAQVTVIQLGSNKTVKMDREGEYRCTVALGRSVTVMAIAPGYGRETKEVTLSENQTYVQVDFKLKKNWFSLESLRSKLNIDNIERIEPDE